LRCRLRCTSSPRLPFKNIIGAQDTTRLEPLVVVVTF
jgi:hypothetical protein